MSPPSIASVVRARSATSRSRERLCRRGPRRPGLGRLILLTIVLVSASPVRGQPAQTPQTGPDAAPEQEIQLLRLPVPDPSVLEPVVANQLREWQEALATILGQQPSRDQLAETYGELGRVYYAYQLAAPAEACFVNASRLAPQDPRWPYYLGHLRQAEGRFEQVVAAYLRTLELAPRTLPALIHLAESYLELNRIEEAEAVLRATLEFYPASPSALAVLGQVDLSQRRYADAVDHLETALAQVPGATRLHQPLAMAYRGLGDIDKARQHLQQQGAVGMRPPDPMIDDLETLKQGERVHLLRGRLAFDAGNYAEAAASFAKAVDAQPESARARVNLGTALDLIGDHDGAIEQFNKALELAPDNAAAHYNLGLLMARSAHQEAAIEHLALALEADAGDVPAALELARVLRQDGQAEAALSVYSSILTIDGDNPAARLGEAALLAELGRFEQARSRLDTAYGLYPRDAAIVNAYARLLAACPDPRIRDGERALELGRTVFRAIPTVAHAETVAMALAELGRCQEAAEVEQSALAAAEKAGDTDLARDLRQRLERYLSQDPCREPTAATAPP